MKCCNHRCPDSVYFNTLLLIINLSSVETLDCRREMSLIGSTSFGFCTKYDTRFSKYDIELMVALYSTNATKKKTRLYTRYEVYIDVVYIHVVVSI